MMAIPERLQIRDTDSEEQRQYKLKKSKGIRQQNKVVQKELETAAVQKSWQKFVAKGARKNLTGMSTYSVILLFFLSFCLWSLSLIHLLFLVCIL